jgi:hypothetical protein
MSNRPLSGAEFHFKALAAAEPPVDRRSVGRRCVTETDASIAEVMLVASQLAALAGSTEAEGVRPLSAVLEALARDALTEVARRVSLEQLACCNTWNY